MLFRLGNQLVIILIDLFRLFVQQVDPFLEDVFFFFQQADFFFDFGDVNFQFCVFHFLFGIADAGSIGFVYHLAVLIDEGGFLVLHALEFIFRFL